MKPALKTNQRAIKNIMTAHVERSLFGMNIYGVHICSLLDGSYHRYAIECRPATRFERYGCITVYHPLFGKWQAALLSNYHIGTPTQMLTADELRTMITPNSFPLRDFLYQVYGGDNERY